MERTRRGIWMAGLVGAIGALLATLVASCDEAVGPDRSGVDDVQRSAALTGSDGVITGDLDGELDATDPDEQLVVVVTYDESVTTGDDLAGEVQALGAGTRTFQTLPFVLALATPSQVRAIATLDGVTRIDPDREKEYHGTPATTHVIAALLDQSAPTIRAEEAREKFGVTGDGTGVAILDTGIDGFHDDVLFPGRTVQNVKILLPEDSFCFEGQPCPSSFWVENVQDTDSDGHGTHVSGIAGGNGARSDGFWTGVAPEGNLVGLSAFPGPVTTTGFLLAGFDYILLNHEELNIKVNNNSWGPIDPEPFDPDDPVNVATKRLHGEGITVVFSGGNNGPEENTMNQHALAPWTVGVAAACSDGDRFAQDAHCAGGRLADFSSRGVPGDGFNHPDVTAPGVHVIAARASATAGNPAHDFSITSQCGLTAVDAESYTCLSGTSMSAPHVTGLVALMQERAGGTLSPDKVKKILVKSASEMEGFETFEVGAGMVDAVRALQRSGGGG